MVAIHIGDGDGGNYFVCSICLCRFKCAVATPQQYRDRIKITNHEVLFAVSVQIGNGNRLWPVSS